MTITNKKNVDQFLDDMKELKLFNVGSIEHNRKASHIALKYNYDTRITSKGIKTLESLEKDFWKGRKFSQKELMLVYQLGTFSMVSQGVKILDRFHNTILKELQDRFEKPTEIDKMKFAVTLFQRGFVEKNPYFLKGLQNFLEGKDN